MNPYKDDFYQDRYNKTFYAANRVLSIILDILPNVTSAVDVGCGVGAWLRVLQEKGINEIRGIDGSWVNKNLLAIPTEFFYTQDLANTIDIDRRYDLAISLEVAEHLPPERAYDFVASLTGFSDFVLFSAAIPYQGGTNHFNEQWPEYWANIFKSHGYVVLDVVRKHIWDDRKISFCYKQNILFFVKQSKLPCLKLENESVASGFLSIIHPDTYMHKISKQQSIKDTWKLFRRAILKSIREKPELKKHHNN